MASLRTGLDRLNVPWLQICCLLLLSIASVPVGAGAASTTPGDPVDVIIVLDRSNSMDDDLDRVTEQLAAIDGRLDDDGVDARYALVTYAATADVHRDWTTNFSSIESAIDFSTSGHWENASDALDVALSLSTRDGARRVIVLVTDEDDDSSAATRSAVESRLRDTELVAIAPDSPTASACDRHDPPCDTGADNELETMAEAVDGRWVDIAAAPTRIATTIEASFTDDASSPTADGDNATPSVDDGDETSLLVLDASANRTTVEVGETVGVRIEVKSVSYWPESIGFALQNASGRHPLGNATVAPFETATFQVNHTVTRPGNYTLRYRHDEQYTLGVLSEEPLTLTVTPRGPTTVTESLRANGTQQVVSVENARADTSVAIPVEPAVGTIGQGVRIEQLEISPAIDSDFAVVIKRLRNRPSSIPALPAPVRPLQYFRVDTTLHDASLATATLRITGPEPGAVLYRYDEAASTWRRVTDLEPAAGAGVTATVTRLSTFAVGLDQPNLTVTDVTVQGSDAPAGAPIVATITVANAGFGDGELPIRLVRADGTTVGTRTVTVPANVSVQTTVTFTPAESGQYRLVVGSDIVRAVTVAPATVSPASGVATGGQPGFGVLVAIVAIGGVARLAVRRR